ncbi:hypothetical protein HYALB_00008941 [Hymenoscyphus albidus]|uniref:Uncharacterized protein n=1 Tax=Hymenoscyphus albidus TaxID=595503 RepID=A0A9N9LM62_9HELO|nr:hypothetical protein HYALB_00008941 [Hymenoscyphus albidus]
MDTKPSINIYSNAGLIESIQKWLHDQEAELEKTHHRATPEWDEAVRSLHERCVVVNGFRWSGLIRKRFQMPINLQRTIIVVMRRHSLVEKGRRHHREKMEQLYEELKIGQFSDPKIHLNFISLCRNKVDDFIQGRSKTLKAHGSTREWLEPDWDGAYLQNSPSLNFRIGQHARLFEEVPVESKEHLLSQFFHNLLKHQQSSLLMRCFATLSTSQQEAVFARWYNETPEALQIGDEVPDDRMRPGADGTVMSSSNSAVSLDEVLHDDEVPVIDSSVVEWDAWIA